MRTSFLCLALFCAAALSVHAQVSPIRLRVEQVASNESDKHKHSQKFSLKIFLSNSSSEDFDRLQIKYAYFGRDVDSQDLSIFERGERQARIAALGSTVVETTPTKANYTEEHGERVGKARRNAPGVRRGKGAVRFKTVEATGTRIAGYGVKVFSGGKLLAEAYSAPSLQELMK
jgi:hypothetical protein